MKNLMHDAPEETQSTTAPATNEPELAIDESLIPQHQGTSSSTKKASQKEDSMKNKKLVTALILVVAILSGVGSGYGLYAMNGKPAPTEEAGTVNLNVGSPKSEVEVGQTYGSPNESDFVGIAEGVVQAGGIDGEGTHQLIRPGGKSQTVYLTSSVVDLDKFVGSKVKIWGETFAAQKAGWLMDVGRVKVLELNAALPEE